ncbi:MAG: DUF488 domain-containing protein, partial [Verrucomicrobiia bacterium]
RSGGDEASLDFQKLLFLHCREQETPAYEFVPYRFGCFSFTSYADKRKLIAEGLLADDSKRWTLTEDGRRAARTDGTLALASGRTAWKHRGLRGDRLVAETYRLDPYYASRSEMTERLAASDPALKAAIEAASPKPGKPGICTIGYEGRSLEAYLNLLLRDGVTFLCDVRRNPLSRKYGFSKAALSHACHGVGIRYEHLPELGIDSEARKDLQTQADYDALFADYRRSNLPKQKAPLQRIAAWVAEGHRVALTCFERLACQCHRHCVAEALETQFGHRPKHL